MALRRPMQGSREIEIAPIFARILVELMFANFLERIDCTQAGPAAGCMALSCYFFKPSPRAESNLHKHGSTNHCRLAGLSLSSRSRAERERDRFRKSMPRLRQGAR